MARIAVDIGGTFTDVVAFEEGSGALSVGKSPSTPTDLVDGVLAGIEQSGADLERTTLLIHGSTVVINAVIERKGAATALVTTEGFRDVYEIGRVNRPDSFNLRFRKHQPLVPPELCFEVTERLDAAGEVLVPFDEESARRTVDAVAAAGVEAVAIVFLHSYGNPAHEVRMAQMLRQALPDLYVTASHEVCQEYREFERTSTAAMNAYVGPRVNGYLDRLGTRVTGRGMTGMLMMMQSNGGMYDLATARRLPVQMMESGPSAGVAGAQIVGSRTGLGSVITMDMGGTTAKACVIRNGVARTAPEYFVGGYETGLPVRIAVVDIREVGTGGGSLAWTDPDGGLHVGPRSAGAEPGPVCYGRGGTQPTVTDANVLLGRLGVDRFLGGKMLLDESSASRAMQEVLAEPLGLSVEEAALGVLRIANAQMANAVRAVSASKGLDPRDFALVAFGGAGPLHATDIARELSIPRIVVPIMPGHFSAYGMLLSDLRRDYAHTQISRLSEESLAALDDTCRDLAGGGTEAVRTIGIPLRGVTVLREADMRYAGQEHTVSVGLPADLRVPGALTEVKRAFDSAHEDLYGHSTPEQEAEIVTVRVTVLGEPEKPEIVPIARGGPAVADGARTAPRRALLHPQGAWTDVACYQREALLAGNVIEGPALIDEEASTTMIGVGDRATVSEYGYLEIEAAA